MSPDKKVESFIKKHRPLTKKEIEEAIKKQAEIKKRLTRDAQVLEQNLKKFNQILDPLIDPETGNVLCWVRRPTQQEWEEMIPIELLEYANTGETPPPEIIQKYRDHQFEMMAKLIEIPKHDAKWWKANANLVFQALFQAHLTGILRQLGIDVENF